MSNRALLLCSGLLACGFYAHPSWADSIEYAFEKSTPIGSWQLREDTQTDHNGKQHVSVIRTSLLGEETLEGKSHYWIEMEMDRYQIEKDTRKKDGDSIIIKTLVEKSSLQTDLANVFHNLRGFGREIIIQNGDKDPIRFSHAGVLADMMAKSLGIQIQYHYTTDSKETVAVPAGSFLAQKMTGQGSTEFKILLKNMKINSKNISWISDSVPFGIIRMKSENEVDGKLEKYESTLIKYGKSGAVSKITKEIQSIPIPKLPF